MKSRERVACDAASYSEKETSALVPLLASPEVGERKCRMD